MNIAYYSHYFVPEIGAPSARIYDLAREWLKSGHRVDVVTCFPNHPTGVVYAGYKSQSYLHEKLDGIDVHRHWTYITPNKGIAKKTLGHVSYVPAAMRTGRRLSSDVAIGTSPTFFAAVAAARSAKRWRIPFIMEVRDLWPAIFTQLGVIKNRRIISLLEHWELSLYRRATKVVVVTEAFRRNLIERGVPHEKVVTVSNGADVDFWSPRASLNETRRRLGLENRFVVLYIGAHGISHALPRILDCAEQLRDIPEIRFLFVGEGSEKQKLMQRATELRIDNVTFLDPVDRQAVREFYALADVCLVPLRNIPLFETFVPSKMFEMMAMARPIIGSVGGEAADILQRAGATVVEPEDAQALTQAIAELYQQSEQARQQMGQRARDFVVANYSRQALAAAYIDVMKSAIAEYRAA